VRLTQIQSPLRYPGGKRRLASYIAEVLRTHALRPCLFVEPFAGGASVSIALLENDLVDEIALADLDELVASFWRVVFSAAADELADRCLRATVDLQTWKTVKLSKPRSDMGRAFKCLFLNRTSFSGILNHRAGPLGGWTQSRWCLDCRFPRERLANRILELAKLSDRVRFVRAQTWQKSVGDIKRTKLARTVPNSVFWYLDPPFFEKADRLYQNYFDVGGHSDLAANVGLLPGHWLVSYDAAPQVRALYSNRTLSLLDMVYTARRQDRAIAGRELLISDLQLPGLESAARRSRRIRLAVLEGDGAPRPQPQLAEEAHLRPAQAKAHG
jgi:DNA adenine methylase